MAEVADDLASLQQQHESLSLKAQNAALEHEIELLNAANRAVAMQEIGQVRAAHEAFSESGKILGDRKGYLYDSPGFFDQRRALTGDFTHVSRLDDRLHGRNRPFYENETELAEIRGTCRVLTTLDEAGIGIAGNLTNYIIGTGYKYSATAKQDTAEAERAAELVIEVIEEFQERVKWRRVEREYHDRARRDGEPILQIENIGGGYANVFFREPDALTEPRDTRSATEMVDQFAVDWSFGIATDIGNPRRIHGYFFDNTGDQRDWDIVPPSRVVHGKRNVDGNLKRGLSDFYPVWQELNRAAKVLRNTGEGAALQSAIAWIKEHVPGTTRAQVQSLNTNARDFALQQATLDGGTKDINFQLYRPGTILHVPHGTQYKPGPMGAERDTNFVMVADAIIRYAGLRWCMPAFMTSGAVDSKTFAGNLVAESPFVKCAESEQVWFSEEYAEVFWKVLAIAVNTMRFRRAGIGSVAQLKTLVNIDCKPPRVSARNRREETDIHALLYDKKLLSGRTWVELEEFDYEHQQELIGEEPEPVILGGQTQRPDLQRGEQQQPVRDVGTGDQRESLQESIKSMAKQFAWAGYP